MITHEQLEELKKEPVIFDYLEEESDLSPVNRRIVRIAKTAQIFTPMDLYNLRAELELSSQKIEHELQPKFFKQKMKLVKENLGKQIENNKTQFELVDREIKQIEEELNLTEEEEEFQKAVQKRLQEEEANKQKCEEQ